MAKTDPFGFDMSVSSSKKKNPRGRRGMSGAFETSTRVCDHPGCEEAGKYRAPKSPDVLDDYFWFCKDHVREYNLKWNFFDGASEQEYLEQVEKDRVWERPTKPFGKRSEEQRAWARLGEMIRIRSWAKTRPAIRARAPPVAAACRRPSAALWISSRSRTT